MAHTANKKINDEDIFINFTSAKVYADILRQLKNSEIQNNKNIDKGSKISRRVILRPFIQDWVFGAISVDKINSLDKETSELHQEIGSAIMNLLGSSKGNNNVKNHQEYTVNSIFDFWEIFDPQKRDFIFNETSRIQKIIFDVYRDNSILYKITPFEFEKVIAELLKFQGFKVELTKQTRDGGFDIIALRYIDNHNPLKFLVECKRFAENNKIGVEIIRSFKEVIQSENANRGLIVTTSYFTSDAQKKQREVPYLLDFKDKDDVMNWVKDYRLK
jgi:hypothetical protein